MTQVTESDYRTAQQGDTRVRQEFIDAVDLGEIKELIIDTLYVPTGLPSNPLAHMGCMSIYSPMSENNNKVFQSVITILPSAFKVSYEVFRSALIDHEGYHARQYQRNPTAIRRIEELISGSVKEKVAGLKSVLEIPAYLYQLNNAGRNILDPTFAPYLDGLPRQVTLFLDAEKNEPGRLGPLLKEITSQEEFTEINKILDNYRQLK